MNRNKFRNYYKTSKEMSVPFDLQFLAARGSKDSFDDAITMQTTGLKDVDGKEIFEMDIVKINNVLAEDISYEWIKSLKGTKGVVWFLNDALEYWVDLLWCDCGLGGETEFLLLRESEWNSDMDEIYSKQLKIIGNVYENPELLDNEWINNLKKSD